MCYIRTKASKRLSARFLRSTVKSVVDWRNDGIAFPGPGARLLRRVPEVDLVMGPQYANRLGDLLEQVKPSPPGLFSGPSHWQEGNSR